MLGMGRIQTKCKVVLRESKPRFGNIYLLHSLTLATARGRPSISSFPSSHHHELISASGVFNTCTSHKILVCSLRHLVPRRNTFLPVSHLLIDCYPSTFFNISSITFCPPGPLRPGGLSRPPSTNVSQGSSRSPR